MLRRFFAVRPFSTGIRPRVYTMPVMENLHHDFEAYPNSWAIGYDLRDYKGVSESSCSIMNYYAGLGLIIYGHPAYKAAIPYFKKSIELEDKNFRGNIIEECKQKIELLDEYCSLVVSEKSVSKAQKLMLKLMMSRADLGPKSPYDDLSYDDRLLNCVMTSWYNYQISTVAYYAGLAYLSYSEESLYDATRSFHLALELANQEPATSEDFKQDIQQKLQDLELFQRFLNSEKQSSLSRKLIEPLQADFIYDYHRPPQGLNSLEKDAWKRLNTYQRIKYGMGHEVYLTYQSAYLDGLNYFDAGKYPDAYKCFTRARDLQKMNREINTSVMKTCEEKITFIIDRILATEGRHVEEIVRGLRYP